MTPSILQPSFSVDFCRDSYSVHSAHHQHRPHHWIPLAVDSPHHVCGLLFVLNRMWHQRSWRPRALSPRFWALERLEAGDQVKGWRGLGKGGGSSTAHRLHQRPSPASTASTPPPQPSSRIPPTSSIPHPSIAPSHSPSLSLFSSFHVSFLSLPLSRSVLYYSLPSFRSQRWLLATVRLSVKLARLALSLCIPWSPGCHDFVSRSLLMLQGMLVDCLRAKLLRRLLVSH